MFLSIKNSGQALSVWTSTL